MYAIVKTGGKQYRVEQGASLLVERLPAKDGAKVTLEPLLYVDGSKVVDGKELGSVRVEARVLRHERGPKLRVVKFKPKRGYKRRTGHRQELTRIEVTAVTLAARRGKAAAPEEGEAPARPARAKAAPRARATGAKAAPRGKAAPGAKAAPKRGASAPAKRTTRKPSKPASTKEKPDGT